jgi:hypothetical protein
MNTLVDFALRTLDLTHSTREVDRKKDAPLAWTYVSRLQLDVSPYSVILGHAAHNMNADQGRASLVNTSLSMMPIYTNLDSSDSGFEVTS